MSSDSDEFEKLYSSGAIGAFDGAHDPSLLNDGPIDKLLSEINNTISNYSKDISKDIPMDDSVHNDLWSDIDDWTEFGIWTDLDDQI